MLLVKTTKTDINGYFDFGEIKPGHYTLIVDDNKLGGVWFDLEVKHQAKQTNSVTIDVSPVFPDCTGGQEFIVQNADSQGLGWVRMIWGGVIASLVVTLWCLWVRRRRMRQMAPTS